MSKTFTIIQLTRLGDLVQTYQASQELKNLYPDIKLKLIARKHFASALNFLLEKVFDEIIFLDLEALFSNNLEEFTLNISKWLEQECFNEIDVLINLSFCEPSNYLAHLINAPNKLGTRIDDSNNIIVKDQWSQLIYSVLMRGPYCPFSLVDLYKNIFGIPSKKVEQLIGKSNQATILAVHPFASHIKKRWKPSKWTEVLYKFLKDNQDAQIHIFGSNNEKQDSLTIVNSSILKKYSTRIFNHVGENELHETFNKLAECTHFIGHDSLIGHLAKIHNLPTLTIALGTVRPLETSPYGPNSYILSPRSKCYPCFPDTSCSLYQCHSDLSYQTTAIVLNQFTKTNHIDTDSINKEVSSFHLDSIDIQLFSQSDTGWYCTQQVGDENPLFRDFVKTIYRVALAFKLKEVEENISFPNLTQLHLQEIKHLQQGIQQYYELCEFGKKYSHYILIEVSKDEPSLELIKEYADKIDEIDHLQELLKKTYGHLTPIIDLYKIMKFNLDGDDIVALSESSYIVYDNNATLCSILYELFEQTINHLQDKFGLTKNIKDATL